MTQNNKTEPYPKGERGNRKEVDDGRLFHVVLQEGSPRLRWRLPGFDHVLGHSGFSDIIAQQMKFSLNARWASGGVFLGYLPDEITNFLFNFRTTDFAPP